MDDGHDRIPGRDILGLNTLQSIPEIVWTHGDDLCDCTFQRIGEWTNPYLARTLRVRVCCIEAQLYAQFPQFVQEIPGYYNENADQFEVKPQVWNADHPIPEHIWHRQLAVMEGITLEQARAIAEHIPAPPPVPKPNPDAVKAMTEQASARMTSLVVATS